MAKTQAAFDGVTFDADPQTELVKVRVLRRGDGKISNGQHVKGHGDELYEQGEEFDCPRHIAEDLEARDFVEIPDKPRRGRPPKEAEE